MHVNEHDRACELVAAACELHARHAGLAERDERIISEADLLRVELLDALAEIEDRALADDVAGAAATLARLVEGLDALPPRLPALTG